MKKELTKLHYKIAEYDKTKSIKVEWLDNRKTGNKKVGDRK